MIRLVIIIIFTAIAYYVFRYVAKLFAQEIHQKTENNQRSGSQNWKHACTEEDYRQILGVVIGDSPETVKKKYKELLAKYHPDKVQHLGIEFQEIAEKKTREIMEAYEYFKKKYKGRSFS